MSWLSKILSLLALGLLAGQLAGCTVLEPCGTDDREYCTEEGDCTCGEGCDDPSDCKDDEVCQKYRYDDSHGVCVEKQWLRERQLRGGDAAGATG